MKMRYIDLARELLPKDICLQEVPIQRGVVLAPLFSATGATGPIISIPAITVVIRSITQLI